MYICAISFNLVIPSKPRIMRTNLPNKNALLFYTKCVTFEQNNVTFVLTKSRYFLAKRVLPSKKNIFQKQKCNTK